MTLKESLDLSIASLAAYGERYNHWAIAFSGGKDSTATTAFVAWALKTGQVKAPESLTVLYSDTRQELPPLQATAMRFMTALRADGYDARVVLPKLDDRFYVYMFGRGVPPPKNRFRWCTPQLKVEPMQTALATKRDEIGEKFLMLTGVRYGESAARDARITLSCSKDSGECGQGWFQTMPSEAISDTLAPLLHWRLCHVWDWIAFGKHGYKLADIALVYGEEEARTGCIGCNLASRDTALENLLKTPQWSHLAPLLELKPLFADLAKPKWRLRKAAPERLKDGRFAKNGQRMGPLTMEGRKHGLARVLDIQARARVDLINAEEETRIREMWEQDVWPNGWRGDEIRADVPVDAIKAIGSDLIVQPLLV
ncbi:MAG TPA: phosphoadenosine phosphosulfate reductase family protein [Aggregatilinea sp.]|uniref:phosphoadenosine phosphosulfate reductase domain-containing protein n=1 Tax=Aggregatilinea sp. TaxID=2806333 RepID=UPI002C6B923E|nr:phosphoadenosine phosphosulfate reductase family protein [Aggregatilinea sp.]HML21836.1 phosphoadenosine phosphosulfate reductase family protein [Aggregatilinea sp.]